MKRAPLYSGRDRAKPAAPAPEPNATAAAPNAAAGAAGAAAAGGRLRRFVRKYQSPLLFAAGVAIAVVALLAYQSNQPPAREMTQEDVDAAVMHTFETKTLPSRAAKAAELVREAVVRVTGYVDEPPEDEKKEPDPPAPKDGKDATKSGAKDGKGTDAKDRKRDGDARRAEAGKGQKAGKGDDGGSPVKGPGNAKEAKPDSKQANRDSGDKSGKDGKDAKDQKDPPSQANNTPHPPVIPDMSKPGEKKGRIGTGVVIVENGIILSSLHVVAGTKRITVTFSDGMESEADIIGVQPENDLAVLRAKKVPDDQPAATLGSSLKLKPGDEVVAVGFPFGIGPSVSAGVVSGVNREFKSPEGGRSLSKLIQFDAAVNPGNSGGPLVTMDGEVVGIVAALLNPTEHRTFIGIGFAVTIESAGSAVGIPPF